MPFICINYVSTVIHHHRSYVKFFFQKIDVTKMTQILQIYDKMSGYHMDVQKSNAYLKRTQADPYCCRKRSFLFLMVI